MPVVVVLDEGRNGCLKVTLRAVVFQQDTVFDCLVQTLDLALGLGVIGRTAHMIYAVVLKVFGEIVRDITWTVVVEQP